MFSLNQVDVVNYSIYSDDEYKSDDEVKSCNAKISVVPEGRSVPEQLARRAFAQGFF